MYVANENLTLSNGAIVHGRGSEVTEEDMKSPHAKANGWSDKVTEVRTKTLRADGPGTTKPAPVSQPS